MAVVTLGPGRPASEPTRAREYTFQVVHAYPHDAEAFTQGLEFHDGFLFEGTGLNGRSTLRKENLETGKVLQRIDLDQEFFGEGITIFNNQVLQLTWQSQVGFVYGLNDFHLQRKFSYPGEGWGLTNNGQELYLSDGTADIRVLDPRTFKEKRRIHVHDGSQAIDQLNELEYVEGQIYANIWQTDRIARIAPSTGAVVGWINCTGLLGPMYRRESGAVLNGIAYDSGKKRLFVTGKLWPQLFEIRVTPVTRPH